MIINRMKFIFPLLALSIAVLYAQEMRCPETVVRIGILQKVSNANIGGEGPIEVFDAASARKITLGANEIYLISGAKNGIKVKNNILGKRIRFDSVNPNDKIRVNGKRYRDGIIVLLNGDARLTVVNELGVEDYLYGVMTREVSPVWPAEALKAQAVVSRTYVLKNIGKHRNEGFDLTATVSSQVYGGVESEDERTNAAVDATKGEVITYDERIINAFFHSCCGGSTEKDTNVWAGDNHPKYYRGTRCIYCKYSPQYKWDARMSKQTITDKLKRGGYEVGNVQRIEIAGRTQSKRAVTFKIYHDQGILYLASNKFRMVVGADVVKSTLLSLRNEGDAVEFVGRGWGHGVGMCQWGAKGMAERGHTYKAIIKKYYPSTEIGKLEY